MATQQRGRLPPEDEKRLQLNYELLKSELDGKDLVDKMFQSGIFSVDDMEEVRNAMPNIRSRRIEVFLTKLFNSGRNGYTVFLDAIKDAGYRHVAETLVNTVLVSEAAEADWFESVSGDRRTDKIQEKELSRMVQAFGNGWEFIATELNLSKAQIEQAKLSAPTPYMQMFNVFLKWKQREAGRATFQAFVKALRACEDKCTIDWDIVKHVVLNSH
ncbi:uncharacterized protein LOC124136070 [Haliotis rufescens]|uniref:uncharacterized protein LOC124136070 n=1 Tax=Haliotis rufescens TaxID=6454 RepID=UPI00201F8C08|nr:uncharacterized protein LOC124136070 [Haliotis rufescens]XP_046357805.2 uncharacterized protein LOC124136070 [Haliotis rufescens]